MNKALSNLYLIRRSRRSYGRIKRTRLMLNIVRSPEQLEGNVSRRATFGGVLALVAAERGRKQKYYLKEVTLVVAQRSL